MLRKPELSSGTSGGERKLMPTIHEDLDQRQLIYSLVMPVMNMYMPGGLMARPVLTSYYKSDHFKARPYDPYNVYTSPNEAVLCPDAFQSMHVQMPNAKYLEVIVTGAMAQYIPTLDYYSGGLPKVCTMYASSECYFGINLNLMCEPSQVSYTG